MAENLQFKVTDNPQTSLQQSTYVYAGDIREAARNLDQTTKGIAESTADIVHKTTEIIVSTSGRMTAIQMPTFPTGSRGPRSTGQTEPRP